MVHQPVSERRRADAPRMQRVAGGQSAGLGAAVVQLVADALPLPVLLFVAINLPGFGEG